VKIECLVVSSRSNMEHNPMTRWLTPPPGRWRCSGGSSWRRRSEEKNCTLHSFPCSVLLLAPIPHEQSSSTTKAQPHTFPIGSSAPTKLIPPVFPSAARCGNWSNTITRSRGLRAWGTAGPSGMALGRGGGSWGGRDSRGRWARGKIRTNCFFHFLMALVANYTPTP
jgi:hypothetical protein